MPWNLGLVSKRPVDLGPGSLNSFTDFTNLTALPPGWSQVSGGTIQFFADGIGSSNGALAIVKATSFSDFPATNGGFMYLHLKRGSATGGSATQIGRYVTNPAPHVENLTGVPGFASSSAFGVPIYGGGFFRNNTVGSSEQTTAVFSPPSTTVTDLWLAGFRPPTGPSRFYIANGLGLSQVLVGGTGGLAPLTQERVEILSGGTDIRICQTMIASGTRTFPQMIDDWRTFMGYP